MNFRELMLERVRILLQSLVVTEDRVIAGPNGIELINPNPNRKGVLRSVEVGPIEELPIANPANPPRAFVSFDGGRNDLGLDTFISHLVEVLSIRIEILLDKKIGVNDGGSVRPITLQGSDLVSDIAGLVNLSSLQTAVQPLDEHVTVQDAILEEWEFDDRYRGADQEVLIMIFQAEVANVRQ